MKIKVYEKVLVCPICAEKLEVLPERAVCIKGHSFDRSRKGYYNLLSGRGGGVHGDNRDMVMARRAFLSYGYYEPLSSLVSSLALEYTAKGGRLIDLGCGEGYYTSKIEQALYERDGESAVWAYDISKDAVSEVYKKNKRIHLAVFGSYHMPVADSSVDTAVNMFSPLAIEETLRVLKDGGVFIMAIPAEEHLFELKCALYDTPYKNTPSDTDIDGLELLRDIPLKYEMTLDTKEKIMSLFMMTPYAYRTKPESSARLLSMDFLRCTAHFRIFVYKKY